MRKDQLKVGLSGATGFLGAAVMRSFAAGGIEAARLGGSETRLWRAEWTPEQMEPALVGLDILIHAAARVPRDMKDASEAEACLRVNALGTLALAQAAQAVGVKRFVFVSTANFVERRPAPIADDALPGCPPLAAPYYLTSKLVAETFVMATTGDEMQALIVRPSAIYGPGMSGGIVSIILNRFRDGQPVVLHDGGRHTADYVFVDDVADLIVKACQSSLVGFLNAGSGVASDLRELAQTARAVFPGSPSALTVEPADPARSASGFSALDVTRARNALGYRPRTLVQGMRDMLTVAG